VNENLEDSFTCLRGREISDARNCAHKKLLPALLFVVGGSETLAAMREGWLSNLMPRHKFEPPGLNGTG
jgi:hypothetical protein